MVTYYAWSADEYMCSCWHHSALKILVRFFPVLNWCDQAPSCYLEPCWLIFNKILKDTSYFPFAVQMPLVISVQLFWKWCLVRNVNLAQLMFVDTKPLNKLMLVYCWMDPIQQKSSALFESKYDYFHSNWVAGAAKLIWLPGNVQYGPLPPHDDVIKWKLFPRYCPFVRGSHRSPVNSPHKAFDAELWCFL